MISALDVASIYDVPLAYHREGLDLVLDAFGITGAPKPDRARWETISRNICRRGRRDHCRRQRSTRA